MTHADKLKRCWGETPKSWLSEEREASETPNEKETPEEDSLEGSDEEETEQDSPIVEEPEPVQHEPEESGSEESQPPVVLEEVVNEVPGSDDRALRDRRRLRRPARFVD